MTHDLAAGVPTSRPAPDIKGSQPAGDIRSNTAPIHPVRAYLLATSGYLALALVVLWKVWSSHPTSTTTCGCGDSSLFTWFLAWPAYAIAHGSNPLFSTALFHPTGVNLLSNTGEVGLGVLLTPLTWLSGPIASLNVALTLSPVLSALAMFSLLRRWVNWAPAAFVGGLAYGFSPVVIIGLTDGHLMVTMAAVPPLIVACLDEILRRRVRRPVATGVSLGLLVTLQFFVGTEVLVLTAIATGIGLLVMAAHACQRMATTERNLRYSVIALSVGAVTTVVLLAFPLWFALAGPAHLSGPVWGSSAPISFVGTQLRNFLVPAGVIPIAGTLTHRYGGYQAPVLSDQYIGIGMAIVGVVGLVVWRRDRRLWLFAIVGAVSVALSLGLRSHGWTPWRLFARLPQMENVIPSRFLVVTYLCLGVLLGLVVDHAHTSTLRGRLRDSTTTPTTRSQGHASTGWRRLLGASIGMGVAGIALIPWVTYYSTGIPLTVQRVVLPNWFVQVGPTLDRHQVVLAFPVPFAFMQSAMTWQAVDRMQFSMAGGGGPNGLITRSGPEAAGQTVLGNLSTADSSASATPVSSSEVNAVRTALRGWGVTVVVLPDTTRLQSYVQINQIRSIVVAITAATGQPPKRKADAWVWKGLHGSYATAVPSTAALAHCGAGPAAGSITSVNGSADCIAPREP